MDNNQDIYELRIYTLKPELYTNLIGLWENEGKPIIEKHMNCIGIWSSESGDLNKIFHLYYWKNYEEREIARHDFYNDINAKEYVKKVKPCYQKQESYILKSLKFFEALNKEKI